ncbi:hypothetical protein ACFW04_009067 [Cataglyphis niger]
MRIVFLVLFYIATYVARIADGGETTRTMPGNGIKHILKQKNKALRSEIIEKLIDDEMTRETNKRREQSLLISRIDGLSQNRKILNGKSARRVKRSPRKRKKRAKISDIANRNAFENDDDDDIDGREKDTLSAKTRGLPIWQVSEPMVPAIDLNSTTNPMVMQTEMNNRSSFMFKRPQSENLNSYPSSNDHLTNSNEKFLLIPVSKDLYVLKNIEDNSKTSTCGIPKHYKLLERYKDKGNATSAILSFKAHMHHDVKDVGKAYLHHRTSADHHLLDYDTNYLSTDLDSHVLEKNTEDLTPLSYPNFLYPGIAFQTRPDLNDAVPEILDQQITFHVPDDKYTTFVHIDSNIESIPYDSPTIPPTAPFFDMSNDVSSYPKEDNYQSNILHTIKLDELNQRPDNGNYENSLEYSELIESTTIDFQNTFATLDDNTDVSVTFNNVEMDNDKELFDVSKNLENNFEVSLGSNENRINVIDNISTQYKSAFDESVNQDNNSFFSHFFINNNQYTTEDHIKFGISISSEYSDKKSTYSNDFNYDNKFINETLFKHYDTTIKLDSFLNVKSYTTSASLLSVTDDWSSKKEQSNVENPRALLKAIEPLTSELKKLLTAVKLVNQSISNVQNRLCDKKIVRSARLERENKERNDNNYFLNKLMSSLQKRKNSISSNRETNNNRRNFLKKRKLNKNKFHKSNNKANEKRRLT